MSHDESNNGALPREHAELAAMDDGSLAPDGAAEIEALVASSPQLADALARQRRAVALVRAAVAETRAPVALRARLGLRS
jgi:hypothetical protein